MPIEQTQLLLCEDRDTIKAKNLNDINLESLTESEIQSEDAESIGHNSIQNYFEEVLKSSGEKALANDVHLNFISESTMKAMKEDDSLLNLLTTHQDEKDTSDLQKSKCAARKQTAGDTLILEKSYISDHGVMENGESSDFMDGCPVKKTDDAQGEPMSCESIRSQLKKIEKQQKSYT